MVQGILQVPIEGSVPLFMLGVALSLFATTSIGIFMGTLARSMPQLGLLMILGLTAAADALRRIHAARKYAAAGTGYYVDHADHPLRQPGAGDIVSRRQLRHRLAAVLNPCWLSAECSLLSRCCVFVRLLVRWHKGLRRAVDLRRPNGLFMAIHKAT